MQEEVNMVYTGFADVCVRIGQNSGKEYIFIKDMFKKPIPLAVEKYDAEALVQERKKPCRFKAKTVRLFLTLDEWEGVLSGQIKFETL